MKKHIDILYMGRKQVAADALLQLLKIDCLRVIGVLTDNHLKGSSTTSVAEQNNVPVLNHSEVEQALTSGSLSYDLGLSMLYWRKLQTVFINTPRLGNINFHPAPLPQYKGTAGYNMAIMDEMESWGATAHYMDENIDTGGIIDVSNFDIEHANETAQSLERKTRPQLLGLFKKTVEAATGRSTKLPTTPNTGGRYITRMEMESMKEIRDGDDLNKKIRAFWFPPYDGAWVTIDGEKVTLVNKFILQKVLGTNETCLFAQNSD
jgi:methionyl-tRNA formyltransferase